MPVEVKTMSRAKAMLIAAGVLFVGLTIIFGIKCLMMKSEKAPPPVIESQG